MTFVQCSRPPSRLITGERPNSPIMMMSVSSSSPRRSRSMTSVASAWSTCGRSGLSPFSIPFQTTLSPWWSK